MHEPFERLLPYVPVPYENVAILVRPQLSSAVVQMEEGWRLACGFLEFVQHRGERLLRRGDIVARGKEMAGVESVAGSRPERLRNTGKNLPHLLRRLSHGFTGTGSILHEEARVGLDRLQRFRDRPGDALRRVRAIARPPRARMKTHRTDAEGARSFQLLGESRAGPRP